MLIFLFVVVIVETCLLITFIIRSSHTKYDGTLVITETEDKKIISLELERDPDTFENQKQIVLQVKNLLEEGSRE